MAVGAESNKRAALSDYLAAERTLLAWIRTGLALMGFGFVVARFGLFLQRLLIMESTTPEQSYGLSVWFGTAMIGAGIVVNAFAGWHHIQLVRQLDNGEEAHSRASLQAVAVAFFLALAGLVMAAYLISVRHPTHSQSKNKKEVSLMLQGNGIVDTRSNYSLDETVEKPRQILQAKDVTLFDVIDHSREVEKAGMKMLPAKLLTTNPCCSGNIGKQSEPLKEHIYDANH